MQLNSWYAMLHLKTRTVPHMVFEEAQLCLLFRKKTEHLLTWALYFCLYQSLSNAWNNVYDIYQHVIQFSIAHYFYRFYSICRIGLGQCRSSSISSFSLACVVSSEESIELTKPHKHHFSTVFILSVAAWYFHTTFIYDESLRDTSMVLFPSTPKKFSDSLSLRSSTAFSKIW